MMNKILLISTLLIFLVACNTMSGTRRYTSDARPFLSYAAFKKDVKTHIVGNPSLGAKPSIESQVIDSLNQSYRHLQTNFTTSASGNFQEPYKVVFVFNPPFQTTADEICTATSRLKVLPVDQKLLIMAVFCEAKAVTEVWANVDYFGPDKNRNLSDAILQLAFNLVPQEAPRKVFSSD